MKLESKDGSSFEMTIVGYEFPNTSAGDGANWLLIEYSITDTRHTWTSTDPCIQTLDVAKLADWLEERSSGRKHVHWLDKVSSGREYLEEFDFTDPVIRFLCRQNESNQDVLRILVDQIYTNATIVFQLDFLFLEIDLKGAAESLRKQLEKFPKRPRL